MLLESLKVPTVLVGGLTISSVVIMVAIGLFALAFLALRAPGLRSRLLSIALVPLCLATISLALAEQLSHPKELSLMWLREQGPNGVTIHGAIINPPESIELWIDIDGKPRGFWIAWSKELEKSLQAALQESQGGKKGALKFRMEPSLDDQEPMFYSRPWPAPPPKGEEPKSEPRRFEQEA